VPSAMRAAWWSACTARRMYATAVASSRAIPRPSFNRSAVCVCAWSVGERVLPNSCVPDLYAIFQQKHCVCVCMECGWVCVTYVCVHIYMPSFYRSAVRVCVYGVWVNVCYVTYVCIFICHLSSEALCLCVWSWCECVLRKVCMCMKCV